MVSLELAAAACLFWWAMHLESRSKSRQYRSALRFAQMRQSPKKLPPAPAEEPCVITKHIYEAARERGLDPEWEMRNLGQGAVEATLSKCSSCEWPLESEDNFCTGCGGKIKGREIYDGQSLHPLQ